MTTDVRIERRDGIGWLTINRPEQRNAVRPQTLQDICAGVDELSEDPDVRAIVLNAAGKHFCSGAEFSFLTELTTTPTSQIKAQIYTHFQGAARRLYHCPKPTLAAVNGAAVTVGCELALACDFRLVTPDSEFQESWIRLGLMPPLGGLFLLPRYIGLGRAAEMCLTGRGVRGEEAVQMGLASEVVPLAELEERAEAFAQRLAGLPPLAYSAIKEGLHRGLESSIDHEWKANVSAQSILLGAADFAEGLAAIRDKRVARFSGS